MVPPLPDPPLPRPPPPVQGVTSRFFSFLVPIPETAQFHIDTVGAIAGAFVVTATVEYVVIVADDDGDKAVAVDEAVVVAVLVAVRTWLTIFQSPGDIPGPLSPDGSIANSPVGSVNLTGLCITNINKFALWAMVAPLPCPYRLASVGQVVKRVSPIIKTGNGSSVVSKPEQENRL